MKFIRPNGMSLTETHEQRDLIRALQLETDPSEKITDLDQFVANDPRLVMRQVIGVLDKIIAKPRSLGRCSLATYRHRTHLADALWQRFAKLPPFIDADITALEAEWKWKIHPYATKKVNLANFDQDPNAIFIKKQDNKQKHRKTHRLEGRWFHVFWPQNIDPAKETPDYEEIAEHIFKHIIEHEYLHHTKDGKPVLRSQKGGATGLAQKRGAAISQSTNHPQNPRQTQKRLSADDAPWDLYLKGEDVAETIYRLVINRINDDAEPSLSLAKLFGQTLYSHFGQFLNQQTPALWQLHNLVRSHYAGLAKLPRLNRFIRDARGSRKSEDAPAIDPEQLCKYLPRDGAALKKNMKAADKNKEMSRYIRLGRLIIHALDRNCRDGSHADLQSDLKWFATSAGQSKIKRAETFTRVWRNGVAMSQRTLLPWALTQDDLKARIDAVERGENFDLFSRNRAQAAAKLDTPEKYRHYNQHLKLVFGLRDLPGRGCRADIFMSNNPKMAGEYIWAWLSLAIQLRHKTHHFNTRDRLASVIRAGVLTPNAGQENIANRSGKQIIQQAQDAFEKLVAFDRNLQTTALADALNQLSCHKYLAKEDLSELVPEICAEPTIDVQIPRFTSILRRAANLRDHAKLDQVPLFKRLGGLIEAMSPKKGGAPDHCAVGLLRLAYENGFQNWLKQKTEADKGYLQRVLGILTKDADQRTKAFDAQQKAAYAYPHSLVSEHGLDREETLKNLFARLATLEIGANRQTLTYEADKKAQKTASSWAEAFKQTLFAYLFCDYLAAKKFGWLFDLKGQPRPGLYTIRKLITADMLTYTVPAETVAPWEAQFYAWLYLVPMEDVSLLRAQLRKSTVLEHKAPENTAKNDEVLDTLERMERLMGLYLRVYQAGFNGLEHDGIVDDDMIGCLYENKGQFKSIIEDQELEPEAIAENPSITKTRRGLRHLLRFGDWTALRSVYEQHAVTDGEIRAALADSRLQGEENPPLLEQKNCLHRQLIKKCKAGKPDARWVKKNAGHYKRLATQLAIRSFNANSARLHDQLRLHRLMLQVTARLVDFALTWERDCFYAFFGMLADQIGPENLVSGWGSQDIRLGLKLPEQTHGDLIHHCQTKGKCAFGPDHRKTSQKRLTAEDLEQARILPVWHKQDGFVFHLPDIDVLYLLLDNDRRTLFTKHFIGNRAIRNNFAHYNVLATRLLNMNDKVNDIRSLLSYDQKLKNAVAKAVKDIVEKEGGVINWQFEDDRLTKPTILPKLENHLSFVKGKKFETCRFDLPQASIRYTSMVRALFAGETKAALKYSGIWKNGYAENIPQEMLNLIDDVAHRRNKVRTRSAGPKK